MRSRACSAIRRSVRRTRGPWPAARAGRSVRACRRCGWGRRRSAAPGCGGAARWARPTADGCGRGSCRSTRSRGGWPRCGGCRRCRCVRWRRSTVRGRGSRDSSPAPARPRRAGRRRSPAWRRGWPPCGRRSRAGRCRPSALWRRARGWPPRWRCTSPFPVSRAGARRCRPRRRLRSLPVWCGVSTVRRGRCGIPLRPASGRST